MDPTKHVLLALTGGAVIFIVAGGRIAKLRAQITGESVPETTDFEAGTLVGWATLLVILVFVSDISTTAPLAVGFAWLIFLMIAMGFGVEAARNILAMMGGAAPVETSHEHAEPIGTHPI